MKISKVADVIFGKPQNACYRCYDDNKRKGVYMSLPVFLDNGKDKPMTYLCHKAVCPICGHIKFYDNADGVKYGIYRLNGNYSADWNMQYWKELKGVDLHLFIRLMLDEPKRQYYTADELPREIFGHRAEFYEPQRESALPV